VRDELVVDADLEKRQFTISSVPDAERGTTLITVYATDHPGLFYRIAGGISLGGANIVDARIHTTRDGMALDNLVIQDPLGGPFDEPERLQRMEKAIADALAGRVRLADRLLAKPLPRRRQEAFEVVPQVFIDNRASNRFTVVEVNALDRPALLYALTYALYGARVTIHSAHVATYGERAVDTFYLTDLTGDKIDSPSRLRLLEKRLLEVAAAPAVKAVAAE
jgi:[protein-PII] uridylyltransferase